MNSLLNRLENLKMHDAWSDMVTAGLGAVGIDQSTRDTLQPAINQAKSVLPSVIPNPSVLNANSAKPQSTLPTQLQTALSLNVKGIPIVPVLGVALVIMILTKGGK